MINIKEKDRDKPPPHLPVCPAERRGSRAGRVPPGAPAEPGGVLGGGGGGSILLRRARDRLPAGRRAGPSLPAEGGQAAEEGSRILPRGRVGAGQRT